MFVTLQDYTAQPLQVTKAHSEALGRLIQQCGVSHHVVVVADAPMFDAGLLAPLAEVRCCL